MATVGTAPSSVAFTVNPYTDPMLSRRTLTYAIANPTPGVSYEWDFGDKDSPPGSATAPFVTEATGPTVTYAYPDPPIPASEPTNEFPGSTPTTRFAVYVVRVEALVPGHGTLSATPQNVVVVPVAPPTANFQLLRGSAANGATTGTGASTAVTHPVTIVPQATLPESGSGANDQIVREDFWFNLQPGQTPAISLSEAADLTCLPDGACGHYTGSSLAPAPSQLKAVPGQQDLGTAPITTGPGTPRGGAVVGSPRARAAGEPPAACGPAPTLAPTSGFESFSINFWNAALANIGSPGGIPTLPQEETLPGTGHEYFPGCGCTGSAPTFAPLTVGYPPLASVSLDQVDGSHGEQGIVKGDDGCFPGYPVGGQDNGCIVSPTVEDDTNTAVAFGPTPTRPTTGSTAPSRSRTSGTSSTTTRQSSASIRISMASSGRRPARTRDTARLSSHGRSRWSPGTPKGCRPPR